MWVYIIGNGWLVHSSGTNADKVLLAFDSMVDTDKIVRERVTDSVQVVYKTALEYTDTSRDKQLVKGSMAE